jgi:hypothetical protein
MTKCIHTNCYNKREHSSIYCEDHRHQFWIELNRRLHEIPREEKEKLK